jgi:hypothetical protein
MLNELFPRRSRRFLTLPLLGPIADDFDTWLSTQGYRRSTRRQQARDLVRIDRDLRRHGGPTQQKIRDESRTFVSDTQRSSWNRLLECVDSEIATSQ